MFIDSYDVNTLSLCYVYVCGKWLKKVLRTIMEDTVLLYLCRLAPCSASTSVCEEGGAPGTSGGIYIMPIPTV